MGVTNRDKPLPVSPRPLAPEQLNAIDLLAAGQTDAAVAEAVGVHRVTVTRWRTSPTFHAALNRRRGELFASATDLLRAIVPKALAAVAEALDGDDPDRKLSAALALLKRVDLSAAGGIGPTDLRDLVEDEVRRRTAVGPNRHDEFLACYEDRPTAAVFAATWEELETTAAEPSRAEPA